MWFLNGEPVPDNSTLSRFQNEKLAGAIEDLFYQLVLKLYEMEEITFENMFVDGTKIEANANRYSFVWEGAVSKNAEKLASKIETFLALMSDEYGQIFSSPEDCYKYLSERAKAIEFVYGKGKRKTPLQRNIEKLEEYIERSKKYAECFKKFKRRKSYSKHQTLTEIFAIPINGALYSCDTKLL